MNTPISTHALADKIAASLFSNGFGDEGTRLEIKQDDRAGKERSLGGWCFVAAVDQIEEILKREAK